MISSIIKTFITDPVNRIPYSSYYSFPAQTWNYLLKNEGENYWQEHGQQMALHLFHEAAEHVPAYKKFLKAYRVRPSSIKTIKDFSRIPIITKKNYLRLYPLHELCWKGKIEALHTISVSSGSTGEPFFWPRGSFQEFDTALSHELFLRYIFSVHKFKTLLIVAYSMGMYVAGPFTFSSSQRVGLKGYPIMVTTPGISKVDVVRIIKNLALQFEQTILAGYPPFVKDILDAYEEENNILSKLRMKFIFGAESFSEEWREYILSRVHSKNPFMDSMNTYGSADAAILGHETPLSILVRKVATQNKEIKEYLFHDERLPSLHQYNPLIRFFEIHNKNELIFTAYSGIPLVRYSIGDSGGLISFKDAIYELEKSGVDLKAWKKEYETEENLWQLPFVYLFGRKDFTCTLYGLNVYPENIKAALLKKSIRKYVAGKFVMTQEYDKNHNQFLQIRVELNKDVTPKKTLIKKVQEIIVETLREKNREYNRLFEAIGSKALPKVLLEQYGDRRYFSEGVKQKWVA